MQHDQARFASVAGEIKRHTHDLNSALTSLERSDPLMPVATFVLTTLLTGIFFAVTGSFVISNVAPLIGFGIASAVGMVGTLYTCERALRLLLKHSSTKRVLRRRLMLAEEACSNAVVIIDKMSVTDPLVSPSEREIVRLRELIIDGHARLRFGA